jgi:hypothetical protein
MTPSPFAPELAMLTSAQAATRLNISVSALYQLIKKRTLTVHARGERGASLFLFGDVEALRQKREGSAYVQAAMRRRDKPAEEESTAKLVEKYLPGGECSTIRANLIVPTALILWRRHAQPGYGHTLAEMTLLLGTAQPGKVARFQSETRSLIATGRIKWVGQSHEHGGGGEPLYRVAEMPTAVEAPRRINRWSVRS